MNEGRNGADPADIFADGLERASVDEAHWKSRASLASNARLVCFVAIVVVAWLAFGTHALPRLSVGIPILAFVALVVLHDRVLRSEARATRTRRFYEDGLARLDGSWPGRGDAGARYLEASHPYAGDLDLFGTGSLFELLATTRTSAGSDRLADWLRAPAEPAEIRDRQTAVDELRPRLDMRLEMAIAGDETDSARQYEALERWATAPAQALPRFLLPVALLLSGFSLAGICLWIWTGAGPVPFVLALLVQGLFAAALRGRVRPVLAAADTPVAALARTASLLACVERERFASPLLERLSAELETTGRAPSAELEALQRLVDRRDARNNQFFAPIAALLLWGTHTALALEAWRARCGPRLRVWIAAAGEIEALCAIAGYAYEHPNDPFPEVVDEGAVFEGDALGHPLLPGRKDASETICGSDARTPRRPRPRPRHW